MITKQEESTGYLWAMEQKGGPGSGVLGHTTPPPPNGSGGRDAQSQRTFERATLPLREKLKLGDGVVFLDKTNKPVLGVLAYGEGEDPLVRAKDRTHYTVQLSSGDKVLVPKEHLRMLKGGKRTRGE